MALRCFKRPTKSWLASAPESYYGSRRPDLDPSRADASPRSREGTRQVRAVKKFVGPCRKRNDETKKKERSWLGSHPIRCRMLGYMPSLADPSWNDGAKWAFCRHHRWRSSGATGPVASPFWLPKDVTVSQDGHTKRRKRSTPNTWDLGRTTHKRNEPNGFADNAIPANSSSLSVVPAGRLGTDRAEKLGEKCLRRRRGARVREGVVRNAGRFWNSRLLMCKAVHSAAIDN